MTAESKNLVRDLKKWAARNKKTQAEVADLLKVDPERVSKWFAGRVPSLEHGLQIQKFLKENK